MAVIAEVWWTKALGKGFTGQETIKIDSFLTNLGANISNANNEHFQEKPIPQFYRTTFMLPATGGWR